MTIPPLPATPASALPAQGTAAVPCSQAAGLNPYVFIVGCPRSGTTLLQRIVDAHPELTIIHETHWIPRWFEKRKAMTSDGMIKDRMIPRLLAYPRFAGLGIDRNQFEELAAVRPMRYQHLVSGIFDLYARQKRKRLCGDKTPGYARNIPTLHALWPNAKFVHLIRDGRDVCLSVMNWDRARRWSESQGAARFGTWNSDRVSTIALWWEWHVRLARESGARLGPDQYHELRYEALVLDPMKECERLCRFLGLAFDPAILRFHEGRMRTDPALNAKDAWLPVTPGLRDWASQMARDDLERFEAAAGPLIEALGYPRAVAGPRSELRARAARCREMFASDAVSQQFLIPQAW